MTDTVHTETYNNHRIEIIIDCDTQNPFTEMDMLGTAYYYDRHTISPCKMPHPRYDTLYNFSYDIGIHVEDHRDYDNMTHKQEHDWLFKQASKDYIILFFDYNYDIVSEYSDGNGIIFVKKDDVREQYNVSRISKKLNNDIIKTLTDEMSTYKSWADGEVYGFSIVETDESCWGFYGDIKFAIEAAKETII